MKLKALEYFVVLAESQSINEAAQKLYLSQPSLTKSLQLFEKEIGVQLFYRGRVGRVAAVRRPAVALVLVKTVEFAHILGVADGLEDPHVLAAGKDIGAADFGIDADDAARNKFGLVELTALELCVQRHDEIPPDQRFAGNPLTLESLWYGAAAGGMLVCILMWFHCYNVVMTSEKFIHLFGRVRARPACCIRSR